MNQLQLMSVCARNDFLVIQASQTRRAAERQLDKQPDRQGHRQGEGKTASQPGRQEDRHTDRQTQHTYIRQGRRIEMKRNEDELSHGAVDAGSVRGAWRGTVCQACHAFIHSSFVFLFWRNVFLVLCYVLLCFAFFICLRVLKCVARKSKESWWVVWMWMLFVAHLALVVVVVAFLILYGSSWHAKAKGK